ncbi:ABC transporter substrate-binding protein [Eisenbergiella sp.]
MKKKGTAGVCAAALACIFILAGCGNGNRVVNYEETDRESITLTFFGNKYEPENVLIIEEIISEFMEENPGIRISYESLKGTAYYEALEKRMAAGKGDDVFMVNHDALLELKEKGLVADLAGLSTISNFTESMRGQMEEDGRIYWVPTTVSVFGLYCNLDLLKEHNQKVPENLGEWMAVCEYFTGQGITPVLANNDISLKTVAIGRGFYALYQGKGEKEAFRRLNSGEDALSSYLEPGFLLVKEMIDKGYVDARKTLETQKTSDDLQEFIKGEAPFMLTGAWAAGRVDGMEPDFSFEVIPYPILEDGSLLVMNADTRLSVNADSEHKGAAMKFVEFFTQPENISKFADQQSSFSPLEGGAPSSVKEIQALIPCYQEGRTVIGTDAFLEEPIWNLTEEAVKKLLAGETQEEVMEWLDQQAGKERGTE